MLPAMPMQFSPPNGAVGHGGGPVSVAMPACLEPGPLRGTNSETRGLGRRRPRGDAGGRGGVAAEERPCRVGRSFSTSSLGGRPRTERELTWSDIFENPNTWDLPLAFFSPTR